MTASVPRRFAALLVLPIALLLPSVAQAATLCVNKPGCVGESFTEAQLQDALSAAASGATHPGPDRIELGPGTYTNGAAGVFTSPNDSVIQLVGAGESSVITTGPGVPLGSRVLEVAEETAVVSDVRVAANAAADIPIVLSIAGTAERVSVVDPPGMNPQGGVLLFPGAIFRDGTIDVSASGGEPGGTGVFGSGTVEDSTIRAGVGSTTLTTRRVRMLVAQTGVTAFSGTSVVDQVLIELEGAFPGTGLSVSGPPIGSAAMNATHVTIVGDGGGDTGVGVTAFGFIFSTTSNLTLSNSVIRGVTTAVNRSGFAGPSTGTANATVRYSSYDLTAVNSTGPGTLNVSEGNLDDVDANFKGPDDFHLLHDSPLVEVADPAALGGSDSTTDLDRATRVVDGDGNGTARRDMGAFEYQRRPPTPELGFSPAQPKVGEPVSFSAAGSSDPEGEELSYAWSFGGAADPGSGETLVRSFTSAGPKTATLVVTDSAGASATREATFEVQADQTPTPAPTPTATPTPTPTPTPNGRCVKLLRGTASIDTLRGGPLSDRLLGLGGRDVLVGGPGPDCLRGGAGDDTLRGLGGADRLLGGKGKDRLVGGKGADRLQGGRGNDSIHARDGRRDRVNCGPGKRDTARVDRVDRVRGCEDVVQPRSKRR
jgi:Ca2+-binding RTX toxin-like protein